VLKKQIFTPRAKSLFSLKAIIRRILTLFVTRARDCSLFVAPRLGFPVYFFSEDVLYKTACMKQSTPKMKVRLPKSISIRNGQRPLPPYVVQELDPQPLSNLSISGTGSQMYFLGESGPVLGDECSSFTSSYGPD